MITDDVRILAEKAAELYNANSSVATIQQANAVVESLRMFVQAYKLFVQAYQVYDDVYSKPHPIWKPKILMFDEATSALDSDSELAIEKALKNIMKNKTVISIAHRLSTLKNMDRLIVLDNGKIIEQGSQKELLKNKDGIFQHLYKLQSEGYL